MHPLAGSLQESVRRLYMCLAILLAPVSGFSSIFSEEPPQYKSRIWQSEDGLPHSAVQAVAQTPDGFLWVGTQSGLARFDGEEFEVVNLGSAKNSRSEWINALVTDKAGNLWVGTVGDGVYRIREGQITHFAMPEKIDPGVLSLWPETNNVVWVGTRGGIVKIDNDRVVTFATNHLMMISTTRAMVADKKGRLWAAASGRLITITNGAPGLSYNERNGLRDGFIRALCFDHAGNLWIGSNSGLMLFKDGKFRMFTRADGLPDNTISALYEDRFGNLWIGTFGGLCRRVNDKFFTEVTDQGDAYDQIFSFLEDKEGNLWVASKEGLLRLNIKRFVTYTSRQGLAHNNVISVFQDSTNRLWVSTWGGGLHCFENGKVTIYSKEKFPTIKYDMSLAIAETSDGSIWFGTDYDGGLYQIKTNKCTRFGGLRNIFGCD